MGEDCLVLFYSWSGNTFRIAQIIAQQTHGELLELKPRHLHPKEFTMAVKRAREEIQEKKDLELYSRAIDVASYKTLSAGTPNWCGTLASPCGLLSQCVHANRKNIIPFCTHKGGESGDIAKRIAYFCIGCDV